MAEQIFEIVRGDRSPSLRMNLQDGAGNNVSIVGQTATVISLRNLKTRGVVITDQAVTVNTESSGDVQYDWAAGDTDIGGDYITQVKVTIAGKDRTFPVRSHRLIVRIVDALT